MRIVSLASSSKGNCTYVETDGVKVLIDLGITLATVERALSLIGVNAGDISAIIISHEHDDHIKGVATFVKKYQTPVYVHHSIEQVMTSKLGAFSQAVNSFGGDFDIMGLHMIPVPIPHDSISCFGYIIAHGDKTAAILTDCGRMNEGIIASLKGVPLVFLESNYDEEMMFRSMYPTMLKRRITGPKGHLSNLDCSKTIERIVYTGTRQIVLSHLSEKNNNPMTAYTTCKNYLLTKGIIEGTHIKIDVSRAVGPSTIFKL